MIAMKKRITFSIVIPTLNEEKRLPLLLEDLSRQSWKDFEVIHVDCGSTDQTIAKSKQFKEKLNLKIIENSPKGVSAQRNRGAEESKGAWIISMDADNRLPSYFLTGLQYRIERTEKLPRKRFDVFSTLIHLNVEDAKESENRIAMNAINFFLRTSSLTERPVAFGSMLGFRHRVFNKVRFNEQSKMAEDTVFVKECIRYGFKYIMLDEPTYAYSMRRYNKNGILKMAANGLVVHLHNQITDDDFTKKDFGYTMEGGDFYDSISNKKSKRRKK